MKKILGKKTHRVPASVHIAASCQCGTACYVGKLNTVQMNLIATG